MSDSGARAAHYRSAQLGLTRLVTRQMRGLRRLILPSRLRSSVPDWIGAVQAVVDQYGATSGALAAEYYEAERAAARAAGAFTAPLAPPPDDEQVANSLRWATKDLWPRDPDDPQTTEVQKLPIEQRLDAAETKAEAVVQKLVADQGRGTIQRAVRQDRQAVGYARAASLGACAFCKLMASRGMVFKTSSSAGRDANDRFTGDASVVKFHDNCHCSIIPVYRGQQFELSDHAQEWSRLYQEYAAQHSGSQLSRFRRALAEHGHLPTT